MGNELLSVLGEFVNDLDYFVHLRNFWSDFVRWRDVQTDPGVLKIIDTGNAEFIITYLDLLSHVEDFNRIQYYKKAKYLVGSDVKEAKLEREKELGETEEFFSRAKIARDGLKRLLVEYFEHQKLEDKKRAEKYKYIKELCSQMVEEGDVFISFNYDNLVERSLWELEMWTPKDGYGFEVAFSPGDTWTDPAGKTLNSSPVKVLKLHGSVGWYKDEKIMKIFLDWGKHPEYFVTEDPYSVELHYTPDPSESPVVIEPSFIKPIEQKELLDIWDVARSSLEKAKEVFIVGYSMPQADAAAQNLIVHSLRANHNHPKVTVVDPDPNTLDRYDELFDIGVKCRCKVEDWVLSLVTN